MSHQYWTHGLWQGGIHVPVVAKKPPKSVELPLTGGSQPHPHRYIKFIASVTQKRFRLVFLWKRTETALHYMAVWGLA